MSTLHYYILLNGDYTSAGDICVEWNRKNERSNFRSTKKGIEHIRIKVKCFREKKFEDSLEGRAHTFQKKLLRYFAVFMFNSNWIPFHLSVWDFSWMMRFGNIFMNTSTALFILTYNHLCLRAFTQKKSVKNSITI